MNPRYFLRISYDGTNYCGWQIQPNANTVQAEVEAALRKLLKREKVITLGCGRTDTGVHARDFYLHFDCEFEIEDKEVLYFKLNQLLPWDIAVKAIIRVHDRAHARFDATERTYEYHVNQTRNPFTHIYAKYFPFKLDVEKMNEAASLLLNYQDFACFAKTGGGQKTTICTVREAHWRKEGTELIFTISANRFLRSMVRSIVGTHFLIGKARITIEDYLALIESKNRSRTGDVIKASGLHLVHIKYPYLDEDGNYLSIPE